MSNSLSPYYHLIFTSLAFLLSGLIFLLSRKSKSKKKPNLPPGPQGWLVVGNLCQVARSGKMFLQYVRDLKSKYSPIFTLRMGTRTQQVLRKHGGRSAAMDRLIERIGNEAKANDGAVWVLRNSRFAVFCILLAMCFGIEMDEETIDFVDQLMKVVLIVLDPRVDDFLPILNPLFSKQRKWVLEEGTLLKALEYRSLHRHFIAFPLLTYPSTTTDSQSPSERDSFRLEHQK
nr:cytochrome P450 77A2 [Ipomoea batatas]